MKRLSTHIRPLLLAALLALAAGTASASQIVVVTPVLGNPVQSGNNFKAAHDSIPDNSWGRRYLVLLEPGVYDLGNQNIEMKEYVDIAGSGAEVTFVYGNGNTSTQGLNRGLFQGARFNELRDLSIRVFASVERPYLIPIFLSGSGASTTSTTRIRNVRTQAFGTADYCTGIEGFNTSSTIEDVQIRVQCTGSVTGIVFSTNAQGNPGPKIRRVDVVAASDTEARAFFLQHLDFGYPDVTIEDSTIAAGGSGTAIGLYHTDAPGSGGNILTVTDTTFIGRGSGSNRAALLETSTSRTVFRHSRLYALPGTLSVGVDALSVFAATSIENSLVSGVAQTVSGGVAGVRVGSSRLEGGPVSGTVTCAGVYDENFTFFPSTCP